MEIWTGIWILVRLFPMALIIFAGVMIIEVGIEFIHGFMGQVFRTVCDVHTASSHIRN